MGKITCSNNPRVLPGTYSALKILCMPRCGSVVSWNDDCCTHSPLSWPQAFSAHLVPFCDKAKLSGTTLTLQARWKFHSSPWQRYASPGQACLNVVTESWSLSSPLPKSCPPSLALLPHSPTTGVPFSGPGMLMPVSITWQLCVKKIPRSWVPAGLKPGDSREWCSRDGIRSSLE